ncbi:DUF975 family protein [Lactobacillus delbrueckii subsp. lactis]|nr:DUF975 family protein [Lactobacillus delbrueckii subsp. lactis]MCS8614298.1 DUF975 family protein [Lactobacillus delbrueckii subsp. lactis]MCT0002164.1 DUF975 family protein [Lactobacillus delbrueckii subsp. lactis]MCT3463222.1 DUF975 family protein [Lactobacillus delbrueckii subsp. lactis]MCT3476744.1 DUF975 family protein [Lactobacillus delbrueckii subsp. lactis]
MKLPTTKRLPKATRSSLIKQIKKESSSELSFLCFVYFSFLELSFIGWNILAGLSLGIGFLWLVPYYNAAHAEFYRTLAGDQFKSKD